MIGINDVYFTVNALVNKYQSRSISPEEFNSFAKLVNFDYLKTKIGLPETYKAGFPIPPQAWQITQQITDELFFIHVKASLTKSGNYFTIPADYAAFSGAWINYIENTDGEPISEKRYVEIVTEGELRIRLWNSIIPPSLIKPIAAYYSYGLEVYPAQIKKIDISYIRYPLTPVWNYDIVDDEPVYKASGSQDFEYPNIVFGDIVCRMMKCWGINIREAEVVDFANNRQMLGQ